jgi:hypothetical protein
VLENRPALRCASQSNKRAMRKGVMVEERACTIRLSKWGRARVRQEDLLVEWEQQRCRAQDNVCTGSVDSIKVE